MQCGLAQGHGQTPLQGPDPGQPDLGLWPSAACHDGWSGPSFSPVISAVIGWLNRTADVISNLALSMGDVEVLNSHHGHALLVEGVQANLDRTNSTPELEELTDKV